jgi:hypothetical protein
MINEYDNRRYVIFSVEEINKIDWDAVEETSVETLRKSVDGLLTFVKYDLPTPAFIDTINSKSIEYTYEEILNILSTDVWSVYDESIPFNELIQ